MNTPSLLSLLTLLLLTTQPLAGGVLRVAPQAAGSGDGSSWADAASLEDALQQANDGDTLWLLGGTYLPTGTTVGDPTPEEAARRWVVDRNLTLLGGFEGNEDSPEGRFQKGVLNPAVLSGDIDGNDGATTSVSGSYLDIAGRNSSGLLLIDGNVAVFMETINFVASSGKPAVEGVSGEASLELSLVNFLNNFGGDAENSAGGLFFSGEELILNQVGFYGNGATQGAGAIAFLPLLEGASFQGDQVTASSNAGFHGAILGRADQYTIRLSNSVLQNNQATGFGGAIFAYSDTGTVRDRIILEDTRVSGNVAQINGGGLQATGAHVDIIGGEFHVNQALSGEGGAIYADMASLTCRDALFEMNSAIGGGAIRVGDPEGARPYHFIRKTRFFENTATLGGALMGGFHNAGDLQVSSCSFSRNTATNGGAWYSDTGYPATFISCLFLNNVASARGGAFYHQSSGDANLVFNHASFLGNGANEYGTGFDNATGNRTEVVNSLLWANLDAGVRGAGLPAGLTVAHCLVEGGYAGGTAIQTSDPLLRDEPGPGPDGIPGTLDDAISAGQVLASSPVIDAAGAPLLADRFDADGDGDTTEPFPFDYNEHSREGGPGRDIGALEQWTFAYSLYVDPLAAPGGDGRRWSTAFRDLTTAMAAAGDSTTVYIAQGTYHPTLSGIDLDAALPLPPNVTVLGGFPNLPGDDFDPGDANPAAYPVIIEGITAPGPFGDERSRNLFRQTGLRPANHPLAGVDAENFLRGLVFQGARGSAIRGVPGGSGLLIVDCIFRELPGYDFTVFGQSLNTVDFQPGAIWAWDAPVVIYDSEFMDCGRFLSPASPAASRVVFVHGAVPVTIDNTQWRRCGGAGSFAFLTVAGGADLKLTNSDFLDNRGQVLRGEDSTLSVGNCRILGIKTMHAQPVVRLTGSSSDWYQVVFGGATPSSATSLLNNGIIQLQSGTLHQFTQSTFYGAGNPDAGSVPADPFQTAGAHQYLFRVDETTTELANCVIHHHDPIILAAGINGIISVQDSVVWSDHPDFTSIGVAWFGGQVTSQATVLSDPLLSDPAGDDGVPGTLDDLPVPNIGSPALDSAHPARVRSEVAEDVRGEPRWIDADLGSEPLADMGAYEFQGGVLVANTGLTIQTGMSAAITEEMLRVELPSNSETAVFTILNPVPDGLPGGRLLNVLTGDAVTSFTLSDIIGGEIRFEAFHQGDHPVGSPELSFRVSQPGYPDRISFAFPVTLAPVPVIYVTEDGHGSGSSWTDAAALQEALSVLAPAYSPGAVEIRVARGTYTPDSGGNDRQRSFEIGQHIQLRGGYSGKGEAPDQRDFRKFPSFLTGDLGQDDIAQPAMDPDFELLGDNSLTVVQVLPGVGRSTLIDGFIICNGHANNPVGGSNDSGAGMFINSASPTLRNLVFAGNLALDQGGGLRLLSADPVGRNLLFRHNMASNAGGALSAVESRPRFTGVNFELNGADTGGAVLIEGASSRPAFTACRYVQNHARQGGALALAGAEALVASTLFLDNRADTGGAVWIDGAFQPRFHFITAHGNEADGPGAVAYLQNGAQPEFRYAVLWENGATTDAPSGSGLFQIGSDGASLANVFDSVVAGGYPNGSGVVDADPMMRRLKGPDWQAETLDDIVVPRPDSWVIDQLSGWPTLDWADADRDFDTGEFLPVALRQVNRRAEVGSMANARQVLNGITGYGPPTTLLADWGAAEFSGYGRWMLSVAASTGYANVWQGYLIEPTTDAEGDGDSNFQEYAMGTDPLSYLNDVPAMVPVTTSPFVVDLTASLPVLHDDHDFVWKWSSDGVQWHSLLVPNEIEPDLGPWHTLDALTGNMPRRLRMEQMPAARFILRMVAE